MHLSLDFWNTLYKSNSSFKMNRLDILKKASLKRPEQIGHAISSIGKWHNSVLMREFGKALPAAAVNRLLYQTLGIPENEHDALYQQTLQLFASMPPQRMRHPDIEPLVHRAASKSILSNTTFIPGSAVSQWLQREGWNFDFELYSDELGVGKPAAATFKRLLSEVRSRTGSTEILHVGDDPDHDASSIPEIRSHILQ